MGIGMRTNNATASARGPVGCNRLPARSLALAVLSVLLTAGCISKPFDVKVVPRVEPERIGPAETFGPLAVRAEPIWDEDWLLETFDANMILAGVLPVRIDLENATAEPVETKRLKVVATGSFRHLDSKKARDRVEKYYGITIRSTTGDKIYKADWAANSLDLKTPLGPGEHRQGFVFLEIPRGVSGPVPVRLTLERK